ncbi:alpha-L-fucosidase [Mucilaginibacter sp.]|uniref:alpha-L-fucosidase n=1 Tax=Mucilaginibacter sp. TaxID=1882438 RepID=UPI002ED35797
MKRIFVTLIVCIAVNGFSFAQIISPADSLMGATILSKRPDPGMRKWRENRFGQFIHWGLYAVTGGQWKGKNYPTSAEWLKVDAGISTAEYAEIIHQFNPQKYNPAEWAHMAKNMGVKYVIITTKHHEGFCLWPSSFTDFSVASTPYKKDLLMPFVKAYQKEGIDVYFYYSILDWHHPDYRSVIQSEDDQKAFERYFAYVKNQLKELITNYPNIKGFWFDGQWEASYKKNYKMGYELEQYCRALKPGIILNNRIRTDARGHVDHDYNGRHFGDFDGSFERRLPSGVKSLDFDWEACMTVPENQWGYHKIWEGHTKTSYEIQEMLATCTSMGGNFVLNFGPQPDGTIRAYEQNLSKEVGAWMQANGKAIYGCDNAGLEKQDWGYFTQKPGDERLYMIVFNIPFSGALKITLPEKTIIADNTLLTDDHQKFRIEKTYGNGYYLHLGDAKFTHPFVITLHLKKT